MDNLVWGTGEDAFLWDRGGDIQQYFGAVNSIFQGDLLSAAFSGDCQLGILSGVYGSGTAVAGSTAWRAASAANLLFGNFLKSSCIISWSVLYYLLRAGVLELADRQD